MTVTWKWLQVEKILYRKYMYYSAGTRSNCETMSFFNIFSLSNQKPDSYLDSDIMFSSAAGKFVCACIKILQCLHIMVYLCYPRNLKSRNYDDLVLYVNFFALFGCHKIIPSCLTWVPLKSLGLLVSDHALAMWKTPNRIILPISSKLLDEQPHPPNWSNSSHV